MESERKKLKRARRRVEQIKSFYWHLVVYIGVNSFISISKLIRNMIDGETFTEAFLDFGTFSIWIFWGIGIFFHAVKAFSISPIFSKDWEERQIQKYIEKDKQQAEKFR
ncbi:2TM domain-containing protein [Maribacter sp. 2210JD10-5]|uniref:2TM domain-containing protein n=1 Tax=Maribacter sp. 2210JD10-5 TaxID=3386272 RepID=UPI0039BC7352